MKTLVTNHHGVSVGVAKSGNVMLLSSKGINRRDCRTLQKILIYIPRFTAHIFTNKSLWDGIGTSPKML